jgi:hypothetical protein
MAIPLIQIESSQKADRLIVLQLAIRKRESALAAIGRGSRR